MNNYQLDEFCRQWAAWPQRLIEPPTTATNTTRATLTGEEDSTGEGTISEQSILESTERLSEGRAVKEAA